MPSYLSEGNLTFNQIRRVHPRDPVAKLDYYLPTYSSSDFGPYRRRLEAPAGMVSVRVNEHSSSERSAGSVVSSLSSYTSRLVNLLRNRAHNDESSSESICRDELDGKRGAANFVEPAMYPRSERRRAKRAPTTTNTTGCVLQNYTNTSSPLESSGFSEGTLIETSISQEFPIAHHQIGLQDGNLRSLASHNNNNIPMGYNNYQINANECRSSKNGHRRQSNLASEVAPAAPRESHNRLRRRKICRNKRMMMLDDHQDHFMMSNPYALSELFSQSEIPGFREIFASDSYLRKFCWIVAFLFMTVLSLNDMTELITEYYEYPITVDVRLRDSARLQFPAVTVCNLNVVRFSSLCSNSRFDLTNQIPSELRDKLCGILVEKKKNTNSTGSDSDIGDINNIGITSTSAPPASLATSQAPSTSDLAPVSASSTPTGSGGRPNESAHNNTLGTGSPAPSATQAPGQHEHQSATGPTEAEHRRSSAQAPTPTMAPAPQSTPAPTTGAPSSAPPTHRAPTTSRGSLDLDDFAEPSALVVGGRRGRTGGGAFPAPGGARGRRARSIQLGAGQDDGEARPFAPSRSRIRLKSRAGAPDRQVGGAGPPARKAAAGHDQARPLSSQLGKLNANLAANRVSQLQPPGGPGRNGLGPQAPSATGNQNNQNQNNQNQNQNNNVQPFNQAQFSTTPMTPALNQTQAFSFVPAALPEDFELTERQERELQENLTNWLAVMYQRDAQLTRSLGHQFDDMILRCTMKSINCTRQRSFENSFSPTEGNCFTFRSKVKRKAGQTQTAPRPGGQSLFEESNLAGTNDGLELVLNLEKNEYISGSSQVGALVMIHHPSDLGYAASEATFIAPEFTTYIGLKMVNITRLPAPYPEYCVDSWPAKFADTLTRNSTYSQQACLKICLQKTIQSHCRCQSAFLPIVEPPQAAAGNASGAGKQAGGAGPGAGGEQQQQQRIIICDTRKQATRQCVREVNLRAVDRVHNCECPPKCQVVRYDKTISMARWPTREDKVSFDRGKMDVNFQNLAKVIVYFQTMTCEEVTQQAVFNAAKLFSALGGIMGMYVGFSFLSIFEIFEVISRKFWHYFTGRLSSTASRLAHLRA